MRGNMEKCNTRYNWSHKKKASFPILKFKKCTSGDILSALEVTSVKERKGIN